MSLGFPNTVLNTIVAESIDALTSALEKQLKAAKGDLGVAVSAVVKQVWEANSQIVFDGDNYTDEWHTEAERRGLKNLRTTPDALPWFVNKQTVTAFEKYKVLSRRELEARHEVALEQYAVKLNIEAETAASMARTMILPAAVRHTAELRAAGLDAAVEESEGLLNELWTAIGKLETVNLAENQPDDEPLKWAKYMRDKVIPAMAAVREVADRLEGIVADDLWPLPKYQEMLFIK
jgi:glutamine synthetase